MICSAYNDSIEKDLFRKSEVQVEQVRSLSEVRYILLSKVP